MKDLKFGQPFKRGSAHRIAFQIVSEHQVWYWSPTSWMFCLTMLTKALS